MVATIIYSNASSRGQTDVVEPTRVHSESHGLVRWRNHMSGSMSGCGNFLTSVVGGRYARIGAIKSGSRSAPMSDPTEPFCRRLRQNRVARCRNFHQTSAHFLPQPCSFRGNLKQVGPGLESIVSRRRDGSACMGYALCPSRGRGFTWPIRFNQTNEINQINKRDQL
jgi:hypothetical protein